MQTTNQKKKDQRDKFKTCKSLFDKTIEKLAEQLDKGYSDTMKRYIKAMSRFHQYSLNNLFLIMAQKPEATKIAGFRTWQKLNRQVKKGEKGIRILAPVTLQKKQRKIVTKLEENPIQKKDDPILFYRTVCVFDQSQTEGEDLP